MVERRNIIPLRNSLTVCCPLKRRSGLKNEKKTIALNDKLLHITHHRGAIDIISAYYTNHGRGSRRCLFTYSEAENERKTAQCPEAVHREPISFFGWEQKDIIGEVERMRVTLDRFDSSGSGSTLRRRSPPTVSPFNAPENYPLCSNKYVPIF